MRLTSDVVQQAPASLNCLGLRELLLRDRAIPVIENLALLHDSFDVIDLSGNMITELGDGFPPSPRLQTLYLGGNRITRIKKGLADSLPSLAVLVLSSNRIESLVDLNLTELGRMNKLEVLSVIDNPVEGVPGWREKVVEALPSLKVLNFEKIKQSERAALNVQLGKDRASKKRKLLQQPRPKRAKTVGIADGHGAANGTVESELREVRNRKRPAKQIGLTPEQSRAVRRLIDSAQSIEEVTKVQEAIRNGTIVQLLKSKTPAAG